jgi:hypothetical protein
MLLLGFGTALRRSELAALTLADATVVSGRGGAPDHTPPENRSPGPGRDLVAVAANQADPAFCPAAALAAWLAHRQSARDVGGGGSDAERPLFCAVSKSGRLSGVGLSDKAWCG